MALVNPHGKEKKLKPLLLSPAQIAEEKKRAKELTVVTMTSRETADLIMMGIGGFTPLDGFMGHDDWKGSCSDDMKLTDGTFWPIPVTMSVNQGKADSIKVGQEVLLVDEETEEMMGTMKVTEKYKIDKKWECKQVFTTDDMDHPGVQMVMGQEAVNLAGTVKVWSEGPFPKQYPGLYMRPWETRKMFEDKGWNTIAALQLRNPMHRSHEYLAKIAIEICDGILIHQLLGKLKPGDIPAEVRTEAINVLTQHYFVKDTSIQSGYPLDMRYAGPREALFHAVFRQNFGCSHLIVGRDHAGVGEYYGPFDAQKIFTPDPQGRPGAETPEHRLDLLLPQVRRHGLHAHLLPRQGRPPDALRHHAAEDALRRHGSAGSLQPPRSPDRAAEVLPGPDRESGSQGPRLRHRGHLGEEKVV